MKNAVVSIDSWRKCVSAETSAGGVSVANDILFL